jgi:hypothetical protein
MLLEDVAVFRESILMDPVAVALGGSRYHWFMPSMSATSETPRKGVARSAHSMVIGVRASRFGSATSTIMASPAIFANRFCLIQRGCVRSLHARSAAAPH